jgi:hypothetical protein
MKLITTAATVNTSVVKHKSSQYQSTSKTCLHTVAQDLNAYDTIHYERVLISP